MCKIHKNNPRSVCSARILRNALKEYKAHQTPNPKPTHYPYITKKKKKKMLCYTLIIKQKLHSDSQDSNATLQSRPQNQVRWCGLMAHH